MKWRTVSGVQVSKCGLVRNRTTGEPFVACKNARGYRRIRLNGKDVKVHTLVATAFLGPPPTDQHTVDHINRIRSDNRVVNLRWSSKVEQIENRHKIDLETHSANNPIQYRVVGSTGPWQNAVSMNWLARRIKGDQGCISKCIAKRSATHLGYEFRRGPEKVIDGEEWAPIANGEVSNMGRIRHKSKPAFFPRIAKGMHYSVFAGKQVHRLVALAFVGPQPYPGATVDHIDRDKGNNRASNLRWATRVEQRANQDRQPGKKGKPQPFVGMIDGEWKLFESARAAERATGANSACIAKCARGKQSHAGGIVWKRAQHTAQSEDLP